MSDVVSEPTDLEQVLANVEPMTEEQVHRSMRLIGRRLWEATQEHRQVCRALGEAKAAYLKAFTTAHLDSIDNHPDRRVDHHRTVADAAALDEKATADIRTLTERSLRNEMVALDGLQKALQSQLKALRD